MVKGFPYRDRISLTVMKLYESGLIDKWDKELLNYPRKYLDAPVNVSLTLLHLQSAFYVLIIGFTLSLFIFFMEIIYYHVQLK